MAQRRSWMARTKTSPTLSANTLEPVANSNVRERPSKPKRILSAEKQGAEDTSVPDSSGLPKDSAGSISISVPSIYPNSNISIADAAKSPVKNTQLASLNALVNSIREQQSNNEEPAEDDVVSEHMGERKQRSAHVHRRPSFLYSDNTDAKYQNYTCSSGRCYSFAKMRQPSVTSSTSSIARCNTYSAKSRSAGSSRCNSDRRPLRNSFNIQQRGDNLLVTPFAQVLASLRNVRNNYISLTNAQPNKIPRAQTTHHIDQSATAKPSFTSSASKHDFIEKMNDESFQKTASETLDEIDWCLEQLEMLQAHRSVSELTTSKFKRLLSRELLHFAEQTQSGTQISEYICSTFLDKRNEVDLASPDSCDEQEKPSPSLTATSLPSPNSLAANVVKSSGRQSSRQGSHKHSAACSHSSALSSSRNDAANHEDRISKLITITQAAVRDMKVIASSNDKPLQLTPPRNVPPEIVRNLHATASTACVTGAAVSDTLYHEELQALITESLDKWGIDMFKITELSGGRPLAVMAYTIFEKRDLIRRFKIDSRMLINYLMVIEENYHSDVPYHNRTHAADVTQSVHVLLSLPAFENVFTDMEIMASVIAAAIHDVDHPGYTNQYLITTENELAIMYNDESVLENHHLAVGFKIMQSRELDPFQSLDAKRRQMLRKIIIDMVRATDMQKHMGLLADLRTMVETKKVANNGVLVLDNYADRIQILQNMIHCADLSNPAKPLYIYHEWVRRINDEFFRQGDREREMGLNISPMCDRNTANIEKSQMSFIEFIAQPLWETWGDLVLPDCQYILEQLEDNRDWYQQRINAVAGNETPSPDANRH